MVSSSEQPLSVHAEVLPTGTKTTRATEKEATNFVQFQNTDGPAVDDSDDQSSKASTFLEEEEDELVSFWDFPVFALLFKWIQIGTVGVLSLMWSLVSGHCVRQLLFSRCPDKSFSSREDLDNENTTRDKWIQNYHVSVIQSILQFPGSSSGTSVPISVYAVPPALVALAILTMFALLVHPEGLTWGMLSNIRTYMISLLNSSSTCWALVVRDYGLVGTVSASVSVALVLILAVVLHRAFLSNSSSNFSAREHQRQLAAAPEKKRKRRKGGRGKHIGEEPVSSSIPSFSRLAKVEEVLSDGVSENSSSSLLDTVMQDSCSTDPGFQPCAEEKVNKSSMVKQPKKEEDAWPTIGSIVAPVTQEEDLPSVLESVVSNEETETSGLATVDSATMSSDDLSCESFSAILPPPSKPRNKNRSRKLNKSKRRGQKQTNGSSKTNTTTSTPKAVVAVSKGNNENEAEIVTRNSNENQVDHSKKQGNEKRSFESKGRGSTKGKLNQRAHGNTEDGIDHKSPKNPAPQKHHHATPRKAKSNNAQAIASSPRTIPASPAGSRSSMSVSNKSGRDTPVSPATQNLFSCELGTSGWSMPALPASSGAEKSLSLGYVPVSPYSQRSASYCYPSPNPSLAPSDTSASLDSNCRMWDSTESVDQNSSILMPQGHPVRAPPGFAPPSPSLPGAATRPLVASAALPTASCSVPFTAGMYTPLRSGSVMSSYVSPSPFFGISCPGTTVAAPFSLGGNAYDASTPRRSLVKENPFADDNHYDNTNGSDDADCRVEAELQELEELGGQMVGSVLDF